MKTPHSTKSTQKRLLLILSTFLFLFGNLSSNIHAQQTAKYLIKVKTSVCPGFVGIYPCATGNDIFMTLTGKKEGIAVYTDSFLFGRAPSPGVWTETAFEYIHKDIGVIEAISIKLGNIVILDPWGVEAVEIVRQIEQDGSWGDDGKTTFNIKYEILDKPLTFVALKGDITPARTAAIKDGMEQREDALITKVSYGSNFGSSTAQLVMKYTETWSTEKQVSVSKGISNSSSSFATFTYDSPATVVGSFGAQAGVAFDKAITNEQSSISTRFNSNTYDWSYIIPGNRACFHKREFKIPYGYQEYKVDGESFVVRKLHAEIVPRGIEEFLCIPSKDDNDNIIPILLENLNNYWLVHLDKDKSDAIKNRELNNWITKGWVVRTKAEMGRNAGGGNAGTVNSEATKNEVTDAKAAGKKAAPILRGEYRIKSKANNKFLHEDGLGDKLVSTRQGGAGSYTRFIFFRQNDGSYKIRAKGSNRFLHLAANWDQKLSTRLKDPEKNLRFMMELQKDGSYRIKSQANGKYLDLSTTGDKLVSTRFGGLGNNTKFILVKQ